MPKPWDSKGLDIVKELNEDHVLCTEQEQEWFRMRQLLNSCLLFESLL